VIGVLESRADPASELICERLREFADWTATEDGARPSAAGGGTVWRAEGFELRSVEELHLHVADAAAAFDDPDVLVFASRHAGETGPLLTAHFTGNFGAAEYGGEPRELAPACPNALAAAVEGLVAHAPEGYEVSMECTHHGPTSVGVPSMFLEVGSGEQQWADREAAGAAARAILGLRGVDPHRRRQLVVFGGGHYAPRATRLLGETDWAVGHVAADWCLDALGDPAEGRSVLERAFEVSAATHAVVEGERPALERVVGELGYRVVGETWVREVEGVDLDLVRALEDRLRPVADGLRFGEPARRVDGERAIEVESLPAELADAAAARDREATVTAAREAAIAVETREGGTLLGERAAFPAGGRGRFVDRLVSVLEGGYDDVERRPDAVVARETAFDPELARTLGVPEGPAFGRLADGEAVEVDGETIPPEAVRRERTHRFPI
jgi:D-aminoacyl-tRNA deacylase